MDLYLAFGGFLVIAILWAFFLFGVLKVGFNRKKKSIILILFFFMGISIILLIVGAVFHYIEDPAFCGTACHPRADLVVHDTPMEPYFDGYENPGNNEMMEVHASNHVTCSGCHDKPGVTGKIEAFIAAGFEAISYITSDYDADNLEAHVSNENCLKCHDGEIASKAGELIALNNSIVNPHKTDQSCSDCHTPHEAGIGLTKDSCSVCHDVSISEVEKHGITSQEDCMVCHNKEHPEDAKIPFSKYPELITIDFCTDCHQSEYEEYNSWPDVEKSFYGDCFSCHTGHDEYKSPHNIIELYTTNCENCHVEGIGSHQLTSITFLNESLVIPNEFCGECHQVEYDAYTAWGPDLQEIFKNCSSACHTKHKEMPVPHSMPKDTSCEDCHIESILPHQRSQVTFLNLEKKLKNDFCSDCHTTNSESFKLGFHNSQKCMDCHGEHYTVRVKFDACKSCHAIIPDTHDESKSSCSVCHDVEVIHPESPG
jgi:hypothetical protein